jgi:hypothetical protein
MNAKCVCWKQVSVGLSVKVTAYGNLLSPKIVPSANPRRTMSLKSCCCFGVAVRWTTLSYAYPIFQVGLHSASWNLGIKRLVVWGWMDNWLGTNGRGCNFEICGTVNGIYLEGRRKVAFRPKMIDLQIEGWNLAVLNGETCYPLGRDIASFQSEKKCECISFKELLTVRNLIYRKEVPA